jgi:glycosyltransferase involved in cell wall biosynthesis
MNQHKVAYIQRFIYPDSTAAGLQTIQMAAAFSRVCGDGHLLVHDLSEQSETIKTHYGLENSPLHLWSMHMRRNPLYRNAMTRFLSFNSALAAIFATHPKWRGSQRKVLFTRSRLEAIYWGLMRRYWWWMRDWVLVFEAHDLEVPMQNGSYDRQTPKSKRTLRALKNYDVVLAITKGLAEDIADFSEGAVKPELVALSTGLPRLERAPEVKIAAAQVTLGYIGTVDQMRGVDHVLLALKHLPEGIKLRIVGKVPGSPDQRPAWLAELLNDSQIAPKVEIRAPVPYAQVAAEIDACDIMIQPAGLNTHAARYAAPLKLFDYMARGKAILTAGVPGHLELLTDEVETAIYEPGKPESLAARVVTLLEQPALAQQIATKAWERSAEFTYDARAQKILALVDAKK